MPSKELAGPAFAGVVNACPFRVSVADESVASMPSGTYVRGGITVLSRPSVIQLVPSKARTDCGTVAVAPATMSNFHPAADASPTETVNFARASWYPHCRLTFAWSVAANGRVIRALSSLHLSN